MRDALKSYLALAGGVTDLTRQRAVAAAKALVNQGEATAEQVAGLAEDLLSQTRQNREAVVALVAFEVDRALSRVGLATADEVGQLTGRIRELEQELRTLSGSAQATKAPATASRAPAKRSPAKRSPARRATPSKKATPAKRATPAKKATPVTQPARAKKATASKATASKATAPKTTGSKATPADGS